MLLAILNVPSTVRLELNVAAPDTTSVDLKAVAPVTPKPPVISRFPPTPTLLKKYDAAETPSPPFTCNLNCG